MKDFMPFLGLDHMHVQNGIMGNNLELNFLLLYMYFYHLLCLMLFIYFQSCQRISRVVAQHPWHSIKDTQWFVFGDLKTLIFNNFFFLLIKNILIVLNLTLEWDAKFYDDDRGYNETRESIRFTGWTYNCCSGLWILISFYCLCYIYIYIYIYI